jgi:hypothetical protein
MLVQLLPEQSGRDHLDDHRQDAGNPLERQADRGGLVRGIFHWGTASQESIRTEKEASWSAA